ncbi:hypothetical protein JTE90_006640 [Oedothorax gibbosus]|uniref:Uncharacterized protein n=1 Tax=Oedothorax gibbosus TaxID=931172 RepID=A0AAV6TUZ7_9ARAC|nr:hypothetical protein JTE90_006640 [Oedothorax gibbosus]
MSSKWLNELCISILLTSNILVSSKPYHHRSKRVIIKDYLNPLTYPTANVQFQKDDDGKYHAHHLIDSKVEYALAKNLDDLNDIAKDVPKPTESEEKVLEKTKDDHKDVLEGSEITAEPDVKHTVKDVDKVTSELFTKASIEIFDLKVPYLDPKSKEIDKKSVEKGKRKYTLVKPEDHNMQFSPKPDRKDDQNFEMKPLDEYFPQTPLSAKEKKIEIDKEEGSIQVPSLNGEEKTDKKPKDKGKRKYTLVKQEDHKMQFLPKPDGKDDQNFEIIPLDTYIPQPPSTEQKKNKKGDGKLAIGQIPFLDSLPFFANPVFIPERSFSMGVVSRLPIPLALDVQDRLPMMEGDEIIDKGLETSTDIQGRLPMPKGRDVMDKGPRPAMDVQDRLPIIEDDEIMDKGSKASTDVQDRLPMLEGRDALAKGLKPSLVVQDRLPMLKDDENMDKGLETSTDVQDRLPMTEGKYVIYKGPRPALDVQDRLPMMEEAEVIDETSETAIVENVYPVTGMVKGEKTTMVHRFRRPFGPDFGFSLETMKKLMKDDMDDQALNPKSDARIVDVLGKKMLLQNKVMKYPTDGARSMYIGVLSVRPLSEVDPETLKKLGIENEDERTDKTNRELEGIVQEQKKVKETTQSLGVDKDSIHSLESEEVETEKNSKADILKVEESKLGEKSELSDASTEEATIQTSTSKEIINEDGTKNDYLQNKSLEADGMSSETDTKDSNDSVIDKENQNSNVKDPVDESDNKKENFNSLKESSDAKEKPTKDLDLTKKGLLFMESKKKYEDKMKMKKSKKYKSDVSEEMDSDSDDED